MASRHLDAEQLARKAETKRDHHGLAYLSTTDDANEWEERASLALPARSAVHTTRRPARSPVPSGRRGRLYVARTNVRAKL